MHMVSNNTKIAFGILTTIGRHYRAQSLPSKKYSPHTTMSSLDCFYYVQLCGVCVSTAASDFSSWLTGCFFSPSWTVVKSAVSENTQTSSSVTTNHAIVTEITLSYILICDMNFNWSSWPALSWSNAFHYSPVIRLYRYRTKEKCGTVWELYPFCSTEGGRNSRLPAGRGLRASGSCEGGPPSSPLSIFHHETRTVPGGFVRVDWHSSFPSLALPAEDTDNRRHIQRLL